MSAGNIKAGGVFVEIGADPRKFFNTLNRVNKAMANMGHSIASAGAKIGGIGLGAAAPFGMAVRQGAAFESVLLGVQASAGVTGDQLAKMRASALQMSEALGRGPTEIATSFLELAKAGMSVEQVLGGAGKSAIEFATVGQMDVATAAVTMSDAMNVFKVSGDKAANTLSAAADSSSTSVGQIVEAFANVGKVGADANQSIDTMSAAIAILGNNMVKGGDAGTALKTMLLRLSTGADSAAEGLADIGLSTDSFRDAVTKNFLPLGDALDVLREQLKNLDPGQRAQALYKIFGAYGLKAGTILLNEGAAGFKKMQDAMANATPVSEKYRIMLGGLSGASMQVMAAMERMAIAISDAVGPAFADIATSLIGALNWMTAFARYNPSLVAAVAKSAAAAIAAGGAFIGLGTALKVVSFAFGGFLGVGKAIASPLLFTTAVVKALGVSFSLASTQILAFASKGVAAVAQFAAEATARLAMSAAKSGAITANYFAGTISIIAATVARAAEGNMAAAAIGVKAMARLGSEGARSALIAGAQVARLTSQGGTQLARLGVQGTAALASVGTAATTTGALTVASFAKSLASVTAYATASVGSALATTTAWAAANVPLLTFAGIVGGALIVVGQLTSLVGTLSGVVRSEFNKAVSESFVVFGDLKRIAMTTFGAVSDALASGDMELAMKVAMDGVLAAFTRGANALLSKVDSTMASVLNTLDAYATYAANPKLLVDEMSGEAAVNPDKRAVALRQRQDARLGRVAENDVQRAGAAAGLERKVVEGAAIAAAKRADADTGRQAGDRLANARTMQDVDLARQMIAKLLDAGNLTADAEQRLVDDFQSKFSEMLRGPEAVGGAAVAAAGGSDLALFSSDVGGLVGTIAGSTSMKELGAAGKKLNDLIEGGKLTGEEENLLLDHYRTQQERLANMQQMGRGVQGPQSETVGTFSSSALGGLGFGTSLAQKQLDTLKAIEQNTRDAGQEVQA